MSIISVGIICATIAVGCYAICKQKAEYEKRKEKMGTGGRVMRILFNLMTTIEVPDAEYFPKREEVEKELVEFFKSEGMIAHGLETTNYCVPAEEQEGKG